MTSGARPSVYSAIMWWATRGGRANFLFLSRTLVSISYHEHLGCGGCCCKWRYVLIVMMWRWWNGDCVKNKTATTSVTTRPWTSNLEAVHDQHSPYTPGTGRTDDPFPADTESSEMLHSTLHTEICSRYTDKNTNYIRKYFSVESYMKQLHLCMNK